jgi:hypothetical protein
MEEIMKRALLSVGIALALAAGVPALANAQKAGGVPGAGGARGGGAAISGGGGGVAAAGGRGAAFAPSTPSGSFARSTTPSGSFARSPTPGGAFASVPSRQRFIQGGITPGGQRFVQGGGANWRGMHRRHGRRFFVGPGAGFYAYDGSYYDDYAYAGDCYQLRLIRGAWRRVYVCDTDRY